MYQFNFHKSTTPADAVRLRNETADGVYLAGGMTLIPTLKQRLNAPSDVVDLSGIAELKDIAVNGAVLSVGAMARHCDVAKNTAIPALAQLASGIGDAQVRNCGTLGGSLANSDPAADYPAAVVALNATVHTHSRSIAAADYFVDVFETALDDGELITRVDFPIPTRAAYAKFPNPASKYAIVGVMVAETESGVRVGVTGAGPCAFRAADFENALQREFSAAALDGIDVAGESFNTDLHASAEYRAHLVSVLAKRAVRQLTG